MTKTNELCYEDLVTIREQFDAANIPKHNRIIRMSKSALKGWCEAVGLKLKDVEVKDIGSGIVEISND